MNYHIICLSTPRLPLLFHQTSPCWGTTSFLWSWTRQAVMIIMQLLDSVDASGNKDLVKVRKYPLIRWGCHDLIPKVRRCFQNFGPWTGFVCHSHERSEEFQLVNPLTIVISSINPGSPSYVRQLSYLLGKTQLAAAHGPSLLKTPLFSRWTNWTTVSTSRGPMAPWVGPCPRSSSGRTDGFDQALTGNLQG